MKALWRTRARSILQKCIRTYSNRTAYLMPVLCTAILNAQPAALSMQTFPSSLLETEDGGFIMAGEPGLEVTGFSSEGSFLAYTLTGVYEGSAFPYCEIHILDTATGNILCSYREVDQTLSLTPLEVKEELLTEFETELEEYGIIPGDEGVSLEYPPMDSPPEAQIISFLVDSGVVGMPAGLYSLDLFQSVSDTSRELRGMNPSECRLNLTSAGRSLSKNLLDWREEPWLKENVYRFTIRDFLIHPSGFMVVFLECTVMGFEIPEQEIVPLVFHVLDPGAAFQTRQPFSSIASFSLKSASGTLA